MIAHVLLVSCQLFITIWSFSSPVIDYNSETGKKYKKWLVMENKFTLISQMGWLLDHSFQAQSPLFSPSSGSVFWPCNVRWQRAQQCCKLFLTVGWGTREKDLQSPETDSAWCGDMGPAPISRNEGRPACSPGPAGTPVCVASLKPFCSLQNVSNSHAWPYDRGPLCGWTEHLAD